MALKTGLCQNCEDIFGNLTTTGAIVGECLNGLNPTVQYFVNSPAASKNCALSNTVFVSCYIGKAQSILMLE
jgi:hypothetical protein